MQVSRSYDSELLKNAIDELTKHRVDFDPILWVENPNNIILVNDHDDVAIFEHVKDGWVNAHYYFQSRGRMALTAAQNFLDEIFKECYNIKVIQGFTPLTNLGARWISRQIGFKSHGVIRLNNKVYEQFILHINDHHATSAEVI